MAAARPFQSAHDSRPDPSHCLQAADWSGCCQAPVLPWQPVHGPGPRCMPWRCAPCQLRACQCERGPACRLGCVCALGTPRQPSVMPRAPWHCKRACSPWLCIMVHLVASQHASLTGGCSQDCESAMPQRKLAGRLPLCHLKRSPPRQPWSEDRAQAGWGLDGRALSHVCMHSPFLATLKVGLGASVGDDELRALAAACPHLRRLELRFAAVSDAGMAPIPPPASIGSTQLSLCLCYRLARAQCLCCLVCLAKQWL